MPSDEAPIERFHGESSGLFFAGDFTGAQTAAAMLTI
jgi:hypothetical protein